MKSSLSVLLILVLISSCKSVDYLIERGDEDVVSERYINSLSKSPNLSVSDIQKLEEDYAKIQESDKKQLSKLLKQSDSTQKWESLFRTTNKIQERQKRLIAIGPIQDKTKTYTAQLTNMSFNAEVINSVEALTSVYLKEALFFIEESRKSESRKAAQYAYEYIEKLELVNPNLSVLSGYKNEALELGRKTVQVTFDDSSIHQLGENNINDIISRLKLEENIWTRFVLEQTENVDELVEISIRDISVGRIQEQTYRGTSFETTIEPNYQTTDVDSSSINTTYSIKTVPIFISESVGRKDAFLEGIITLHDLRNDEIIGTKELLIFFRAKDKALSRSSYYMNYNNPDLTKIHEDLDPLTDYSDILFQFSENIATRIERFTRKVSRS